MGRHSSGRTGPFIRSIIGWLLPWALIATVVSVGAWMFIDYRQREGTTPVAQASEERPASTAQETDDPVQGASPTEEIETRTPEPTPPKESKDDEPRRDRSIRLITQGVSVQVLNGTTDPAAGEAMAERLTALGYQVVTVESTSKPYKATTVYWSFPDAERAGSALAERFGWDSDMKPGNLAATVSLHVVVGRDFKA